MLQDLGKALGMQCVVFNCGEHLDYHFMAKFLSGALALLVLGVQAALNHKLEIGVGICSCLATTVLPSNGLSADYLPCCCC